MDTIILLLKKDIASIIFQYLSVSKDEIIDHKNKLNLDLENIFCNDLLPNSTLTFVFKLHLQLQNKLYGKDYKRKLVSNLKIENVILKIKKFNIVDQTLYW